PIPLSSWTSLMDLPRAKQDHNEWSSDMNFLDEHRWSGKIFTGEWTAPDGGTIAVMEPATGIEIGRVGEASHADLERSVAQAGKAQTDWAAVSFTERAAVMRRAAELWTDHAEEVHSWLMRE